MAKPIKETPVLKGRDARKFAKKIANPTHVSIKEMEMADKVFAEFKSIAKFAL
jgi:hypothetical protein